MSNNVLTRTERNIQKHCQNKQTNNNNNKNQPNCLLGRLIGLAFALPLAWFALKRAIPRGYGWRLVALLLLGGSQGALGWYMVQSGLVERTDVSHFRLSAHLLLALFILAALIWTALDLRQLARTGEDRPARLTGAAVAVGLILFVQLLLGAWVAGLNAGYVASDWPLMQGQFWPDGIDWCRWRRLRRSPTTPICSISSTAGGRGSWSRRWSCFARKVKPIDRRGLESRSIRAFGTQILLGIATVMTGMAIVLAVLHQAVGALLVAAVRLGRACAWEARHDRRHRLRRLRRRSRGPADRPPDGRGTARRLRQHPRTRAAPIYRWEGAIEERDRGPGLFKTTAEMADALIARIKELHSYSVPALAVWPIDKLLGDLRRLGRGNVRQLRVIFYPSANARICLTF